MARVRHLEVVPRMRARLALIAVLALAATAIAMTEARPADAYVDWFCPEVGSIWYPSGSDCGYGAYHHLDTVEFVETSSGAYRHCANFVLPDGGLAAWKCGYETTVVKYPGGQAGYGYVHNGDPGGFYAYALETF